MAEQIAIHVVGKDGKLTESFEDNLQIAKVPVPAPQDGEVLARLIYRCDVIVCFYVTGFRVSLDISLCRTIRTRSSFTDS